jgi:hypothetical protein
MLDGITKARSICDGLPHKVQTGGEPMQPHYLFVLKIELFGATADLIIGVTG